MCMETSEDRYVGEEIWEKRWRTGMLEMVVLRVDGDVEVVPYW